MTRQPLKLLYGMKEDTETAKDMTLDELAGWMHVSLGFFLKRYEGTEIKTREEIYGICNVPWEQIRREKQYAWAHEWLLRVAEQLSRDFNNPHKKVKL